MRVIGCQTNIQWENPEANFVEIERLLEPQQVEPDSLIVLPEMFATGFSMNVSRIANLRSAEQFLTRISIQYQSWVVAGVVGEASDGRGSNRALVISPDGQEIGSYTKIHPFTFGGENQHYAPGGEVNIFEINGVKLCPFVCYDLRFPEIFRTAAVRGAEVFTVIANWPKARSAHWTALLQARAIENQAFVLGVNRTGRDPHLEYDGQSAIVAPLGETLSRANDEAGCVAATLDLANLKQWREKFPALADARHPFTPNGSGGTNRREA